MALDQDDHETRRLYAELTVLRTLVEALLAEQIQWLEKEGRPGAFSALLELGGFLGHRATDELEAEASADIAVQAQERLRMILQRVAKRTGTEWTPTAADPLSEILFRRS